MASKKPNYADNIIIPEKIDEHEEAHFEALKRAKRVITILSLYTSTIHEDEIFSYSIKNGLTGNLKLPKHYNFDGFKIKYLPGWGSYFVIIDLPNIEKVEISIKTPHGKDEFEQDLQLIRIFISRYTKASGQKRARISPFEKPKLPEISSRQQEIINFENRLKKLGRMTTATD